MDTKERTFEATVDNLHEALNFIEEELETHGASMKATNVILVSAEEIYANVAMYAYEGRQLGNCKIITEFEDDSIKITFIDSGMPFNPLAKIDPDVHAAIEDRGIGGLGIYMVKNTMDECTYAYENEQNIFSMKRTIK